LLIKSPEKRCGKTTALMVIQNLVYRPLPTSNITTSALFRTIEAVRPTLLIDEVDTFLSTNEELRGIINSGHFQATAHVTRTVGDDFEPRQFSTWAPMATAGIGKLPGTIEDRGIAINLRRRRRDEHVQRLRFDRVDHLKEAASRAFRWANDHRVALANRDPEIPEALHDRAADNWRPLMAIADCAGGEWPARARRAALELSADSAADQDSIGTLLLGDIRAAFEAKGIDRISSDDLAAYLVGLDDRPWPEFSKGKPLTKAGLARLLSRFKIVAPGTIRLPAGGTLKGYYLSGFDDAFARYLPTKNVTPSQAYSRSGCDTFENVTTSPAVTLSKTSRTYSRSACDGVTFLEPENEVGER
jgi:putative DNA primase/helicase